MSCTFGRFVLTEKSVQLIVKRKGINLTEYGLVDAAMVKRQRLNKDTDGPVSLQM